MQIFGKIGDRRGDGAMHRMDPVVGRAAQRDQAESEARLFQPEKLLRDKGFGQARISFEDDGNGRPHARPSRPVDAWRPSAPLPSVSAARSRAAT